MDEQHGKYQGELTSKLVAFKSLTKLGPQMAPLTVTRELTDPDVASESYLHHFYAVIETLNTSSTTHSHEQQHWGQ